MHAHTCWGPTGGLEHQPSQHAYIEKPYYGHHAAGDAYEAEKNRYSLKRRQANATFNVLRDFFHPNVLADPERLRNRLEDLVDARACLNQRDKTEAYYRTDLINSGVNITIRK